MSSTLAFSTTVHCRHSGCTVCLELFVEHIYNQCDTCILTGRIKLLTNHLGNWLYITHSVGGFT